MAVGRTILFTLAFYTGSVLIISSGLVWSIFDERAIRSTTRRWSRYHRWCAAALLGIRVCIEGVVPRGSVLIAGKHQSFFEAIDVLTLIDDPIVVMKKSLADIPGWGRIARRYGIIAIDRAGGAATLRAMMAAACAAVATGRPIFIFPEGTRVMPGDAPPLQSGFAGLYRTLGLPVVPVATNAGKLWPRTFVKQAGTITYRFGETIPSGLKRDEIETRVHAAINALDA